MQALRPLHIILAEIDAHRRVVVRPRVPERVTVEAGQHLILEVPYHLEESSGGKERFRFELRSQIGSQAADPVQIEWKDIPIVHDKARGVMEQRYVLDKAGEYALEFIITAEYQDVERGTRTLQHRDCQTYEGSVVVEIGEGS